MDIPALGNKFTNALAVCAVSRRDRFDLYMASTITLTYASWLHHIYCCCGSDLLEMIATKIKATVR